MKILLSALFNPQKNDAVKIHFLEVAKALTEIGYDTKVLIPKGKIEKKFTSTLDIIQLPTTYSDSILSVLKNSFWQLIYFVFLVDNSFDALYLRWRLLPSVCFKILSRLRSKKLLIITEQNGWAELESKIDKSNLLKRVMAKKFQVNDARFADIIISVTAGIKEQLIQNGIAKNKIFVIENGTDTKQFYILPNRKMSKAKEFGNDEIVLGFIGNVALWQGLEELLKAFESVSKLNKNLILLLIVSGNVSSLLTNEIVKKYQDKIIIKENIPYSKMNYWINLIDIAFAPKSILYEEIGYSPLKIRDYAACGKTIISTDVKGIRELEKYTWMYIYNPKKQYDLIDKIENALHCNLEKNAEQSRLFAEENFDWKIIATKINEIICENN